MYKVYTTYKRREEEEEASQPPPSFHQRWCCASFAPSSPCLSLSLSLSGAVYMLHLLVYKKKKGRNRLDCFFFSTCVCTYVCLPTPSKRNT